MREMDRWLRIYDNLRTKAPNHNEGWTSTIYDIQGMHWQELQAAIPARTQYAVGSCGKRFKKIVEEL